MGICGPVHDERSWTFDLDPGGRDPVLGIERLQEAYFARFPGYDRGITVPAIVDIPTGQVVTNDFAQMTLDLSTRVDGVPPRRRARTCTRRTAARRSTTSPLKVFQDVNNGVYQCGFAGQPAAPTTRPTGGCSARLDWLAERLAGQRYLVGDTITEADVRLFTTLARFDAVYHGHFKCNRQKLTELPVLWAYARDLFQTPGFGDTIDFDHIKRHYYVVHRDHQPVRHRAARPGPTPAGWPRTTGPRSAAARSATARRPARPGPPRPSPPGHSPLRRPSPPGPAGA